MPDAGAKAALQGFRRQALYTLARVVEEGAPQRIFHLEGNEDLDVYDGPTRLAEVLQVKAYGTGLALSAFSPDKARSFLHRAADLARDADLSIRVVTFGPLGPELEGAWAGDPRHRNAVAGKLRRHGFTDDRIARLFSRVEFERVDEAALRARVFNFLRDSLAGGDPASAFDLLVAWLYVAAEEGRRITRAELIARVNAVGRYLAERHAHHAEWFTSILPVEDVALDEEHKRQLAAEFYRGVAARYEHVLAGNDVLREARMEEINRAFAEGARVVLVHGASGQGKSTLVHRYLHDYVPEEWRFAVAAVADRRHGLSVAAALAGHLRAVGTPMYVHIDVSPRDLDWPELVRALVRQPNVRILVSIREEDLARLTVPGSELGFPRTVPLEFDEREAEPLFERLAALRPAGVFPSFRDAWERFGGSGPLMEFVYLVTQTESLGERLAKQVRRLREEVRQGSLSPVDLALLRATSVANAFEARIDVAALATALGVPDPAGTLELFEREYLLRRSRDGRHAEALHPIRSEILARLLTDPGLSPWGATAITTLPYVPEQDLEAFLLYAFARHPDAAPALEAALGDRQPRTWTGLAGIARALLWRGVQSQSERDRDVTDEAYRHFRGGWWVALNFDLVGALAGEDGMLALMEKLNPAAAQTARELRARQSDPHHVFEPLEGWLSRLDAPPAPPATPRDWDGLAEVHFWAARQQIPGSVTSWARAVDLGAAAESLPLPAVAELVLSLSNAPSEQFETQVGPWRDRIMERFRRETLTVVLEDAGDALRMHYIVTLQMLQGRRAGRLPDAGSSQESLEGQRIELTGLLRKVAPGFSRYGTQGYGHRGGVVELPFDPTENVQGTDVCYLHPRWLPALNGTYNNFVRLRYRLATWSEYAEGILATRESVVRCLGRLPRALDNHFRSRKPVKLLGSHLNTAEWDAAVQQLELPALLPRAVVDEWGFVGEGQSHTSTSPFGGADIGFSSRLQAATLGPTLDRYRPYLKSLRKYTSPLANFLQQAISPLLYHPFRGRYATSQQRQAIEALAEQAGLNAHKAYLSAYNLADARRHLGPFQREFRARFARLVDADRLARVEREERELLDRIWPLYYQFALHPERQVQAPERQAVRALDRTAEAIRGRILEGLSGASGDGLHAGILTESTAWEDQAALWLRLDLEDPVDLYLGIGRVVEVLADVFGSVELRSMEQFVIEDHWHTVVVIPLVGGRNLAGAAWRFHPLSFFGERDVLEKASWMLLPVPLPEDAAQHLGIKVLADPDVETARQLQEAAAELFARLVHYADLSRIPGDLDPVGEQIVREYLDETGPDLNGAWQRVIDAVTELHGELASVENLEERAYLVEIIRLLSDIQATIVPAEMEDGSLQLAFDAFPEWAERLRQILPLLDQIRLLRTADAIGLGRAPRP